MDFGGQSLILGTKYLENVEYKKTETHTKQCDIHGSESTALHSPVK